MPIATPEVLKAAKHARAAIRRGDLRAAERWLTLTERTADIARRLDAIARAEELLRRLSRAHG